MKRQLSNQSVSLTHLSRFEISTTTQLAPAIPAWLILCSFVIVGCSPSSKSSSQMTTINFTELDEFREIEEEGNDQTSYAGQNSDPVAGDPERGGGEEEMVAGETSDLSPSEGGEILPEGAAGEMIDTEPPADQPQWVNMCQKWRSLDHARPNVMWSGDVNQCVAGDVDEATLNTVLNWTNFYRELAGVDPVTLHTANQDALQECALMMEANGRLSHAPPEEWSCYTSSGAGLAGRSNLAGSHAIDAMGMYMVDSGNGTTMGHRRWILSIGLETIGVGSSSSYSCMEVLHLHRPSGWVAYPSPGAFPIQLTQDRWGRSIDQTGWSIQYDGLSLRNPEASITVFDLNEPAGEAIGEGIELPIEIVELRPNYGSAAALNLIPQGWRSESGKRYVIKIQGEEELLEYEVDMVDCTLAP